MLYLKTKNNFRDFLFSKSFLSRLVLINITIYIVVLILGPINADKINEFVFSFLALNPSLNTLLKTPWTILSYMFVHTHFLNLLFNIIMLYFCGILFSQYLGQRKFAYTYFIGGFVGALLYIIAYNLEPSIAGKTSLVAVGASAPIMAILAGITTYMPNYEVNVFFGRLKLKYLLLFFIALDIMAFAISSSEIFTHLGGALYGFASIYLPKLFKQHKKLKVLKNNTRYSKRPITDEEYNRQRAKKQNEIDAILDKISKSGYESLTEAEKKILFDAGK